MFLSQALERLHAFTPEQFNSLADVLSPGLIAECLQSHGAVTLRKRRLPMEMMVWSVVGMALFRHLPMHQVVNQLDIMLPGKRPFVAPSAVVQARQRLGDEVIREVFAQTQSLWQAALPQSHWCGLRLLGVDGVVWRTPDSAENQAVFARTSNQKTESHYPQVRMVCQMELSSHLLVNAELDSVAENEMNMAAKLIDGTPDNSLTVFDKGFYSLGLLHKWQSTGCERQWLLPLKKRTHYRTIKVLGQGDELVELAASPQALKKWPTLPATMTARLVTKSWRGKRVQMLTSLLDTRRYPGDEIVDLYSQRWEIELGYREMKQYLLQNRLTLRSKTPAMVKQELWGVLLAYNVLRFQMAQMAYSLKNIEPNELSFARATAYITKELMLMPFVSPGRVPEVLRDMLAMAPAFVLPDRRERHCPRVVKPRPQRYASAISAKKVPVSLN